MDISPEKKHLHAEWRELTAKLEEIVGKKPKDLNAVLFMIGVQELGRGPLNYSKEEKQDLMHIAICRIFEPEGYYELIGIDPDGWPHYEVKKVLPYSNIVEQVSFIRERILNYFKSEGVI